MVNLKQSRCGKRRKVQVGEVYGRLKITKFCGRNKYGNLIWDCICTCGIRCSVSSSNLLSGSNVSCGCHKAELTRKRNLTHGLSHLPEYSVWLGMKARCNNPNNADWKSYGGRGIKLVDRWNSFDVFYSDMGPIPSSKYTIERIDNNKNYSPNNCIWATRKTQARNKRNIPLYEYDGKTLCVAEWAEIVGLHPETLRSRIKKGWSIEKALTTKSRGKVNATL